MFEPLIALALFGGLVWVIAHAVFMLVHGERGAELFPEHRDTLARFVEENYGARFVPGNALGEEGMRRH